jgi:hypothetical protein
MLRNDRHGDDGEFDGDTDADTNSHAYAVRHTWRTDGCGSWRAAL